MIYSSFIKSFQSYSGLRTDRHAVILAGGEGSRLKSLTRAIAGDERPKQFCSILDDRTLLDATRERTALVGRPFGNESRRGRMERLGRTAASGGHAQHTGNTSGLGAGSAERCHTGNFEPEASLFCPFL